MHSLEIKKKFIEFFQARKHSVIPNESLIPENDSTSLFITAGMQPLVPYLSGRRYPLGKRLVNIQRCVRTDDIEEVGDTIHMTFFEMLGYWSLGDYFKEQALRMTFEFLTSSKYMNFDPSRLYVTVFKGNQDVSRDEKAIEVWKDIFANIGIDAEVYNGGKVFQPNVRIFPLAKKENWWGPVGSTGPCGPCSEIFYWRGQGPPDFKKFVPWDDSNMFIELGNDVFMAYEKDKEAHFNPLKAQNVDFGGGLERLTLVSQLQDKNGSVPRNLTIFNTDLFDTPTAYLRSLIEDESKISTLKGNQKLQEITEFDCTLTGLSDVSEAVKSFRIILDHMRASVFLIADLVRPSNKDQGYILRRLIRRAVRHARLLSIQSNFTRDIAQLYIDKYKVQYPHLEDNSQDIINILEKEEINFMKMLQVGRKEIDKLRARGRKVTGKNMFFIYETYGFPIEMTLDELGISGLNERKKYESEFYRALRSHQKQSRKGAKGRFKGGLGEHNEVTKAFHTATHLLLRALQLVLGDHVHQRGSNITNERLRFDFSHSEKLTDKQLKRAEDIVNEKIKQGLVVEMQVMKKEEALKIGAEHEFDKKYPDKVSVCFIKDSQTDTFFSKEFCGGPHVGNTSKIGELGRFEIQKQESLGANVRRIKARLIIDKK